MGGPVFYISRGPRLSTFAHVLGGGARITGVLISPKGDDEGLYQRAGRGFRRRSGISAFATMGGSRALWIMCGRRF